jgi:hypothetical protein
MAKLSVVSQTAEKVTYGFQCPGCKDSHHVAVPGWDFNGNMEKPTFSPSLLVRCGHYIPNHQGSCWCTFNAERPDDPAPFNCYQCHSYIRDGRIEFLGDCSHPLAGQTVDMPDI